MKKELQTTQAERDEARRELAKATPGSRPYRVFSAKAADDVDKLLGVLREALDAPGHDANDHNCEDWPPGTGCRGCAGDATRKRLRTILTEQEGK